MNKRLTIEISDEEKHEIKILAAKENLTLKDLVLRLVRDFIASKQ